MIKITTNVSHMYGTWGGLDKFPFYRVVKHFVSVCKRNNHATLTVVRTHKMAVPIVWGTQPRNHVPWIQTFQLSI